MKSLPLHFSSEAKANHNFDQPWQITSGEMAAKCAIPPEFGGKGGGFSPEDLFLQAAINCFVGTFKVVAQLSKLIYSEVHVMGQLCVDKNDLGQAVMKTIHLEISVTGVQRPDRLENIVAKTIRDGFILNSMKTVVTYKLNSEAS